MTELKEANAKEYYVLLNRVRMLEKFWNRIGYPFIEINQSCCKSPCDYVEGGEYQPPEGPMKQSSMYGDIEKLRDRIRQLENFVSHLGYPNSELYADFDKDDVQRVFIRKKAEG